MRIAKLSNTIQPYDWGSTTLIPSYLGIENQDGGPMAELWMGAHSKAPSRIILDHDAQSLDSVILKRPIATLGTEVTKRYDGELPFLFKVLAAARGLSIQAHPNREQARAGFAREEAAGVPLDSPERNYKDRNHKPEIICALSEFWALCGFRPIRQIAREFRGKHFDVLSDHVEGLRRDRDGALSAFFEAIIRSADEQRSSLIRAALEHAEGNAGSGAMDRYYWVKELHRQFGEDIGVLAPLYLNCVRLRPSEALFLSAGVLHAYLSGIGVELMANSDNVLRGGCTSKHVDVDELLSVLTFDGAEAEVLFGRRVSDVELVYDGDASEFQLTKLVLDGTAPRAVETAESPEIMLCTDGNLTMSDESGIDLPVQRGESVFVPASAAHVSMRGSGTVFRARVPVS